MPADDTHAVEPDTSDGSTLYERDFVAWARDQAERLRKERAAGSNLAIDWPHLIDAVDDLGDRHADALVSSLCCGAGSGPRLADVTLDCWLSGATLESRQACGRTRCCQLQIHVAPRRRIVRLLTSGFDTKERPGTDRAVISVVEPRRLDPVVGRRLRGWPGARIDADRIRVISDGKESPDGIGSNEEAWVFNRRTLTVIAE